MKPKTLLVKLNSLIMIKRLLALLPLLSSERQFANRIQHRSELVTLHPGSSIQSSILFAQPSLGHPFPSILHGHVHNS